MAYIVGLHTKVSANRSNHRLGVRFIFSALNNDISTKYTGTCRIKVQVNQPSAKKTRT